MLFSRKTRFHDVARLTVRCVLFATICHNSPIFGAIHHNSRLFVLFATIRCSLFATIRYSGFRHPVGCECQYEVTPKKLLSASHSEQARVKARILFAYSIHLMLCQHEKENYIVYCPCCRRLVKFSKSQSN